MAEGTEQEDWWKPARTLKALAQMWPIYLIQVHAMGQGSHMSEPHVKGQAGALPPQEVLRVTRHQEAEGASADSSTIYHSSLLRQES